MQILVVEDEAALREVMATILVEAGYKVVTAADGLAAMTLLNGMPQPPQLILLDLMLPHMTGVELCAALRRNPTFAAVPIMVLTAAATHVDSAPALNGIRILHKPITIDALLSAIQQACVQAEL
ncbi:MAG TPA: response regulator transcription factor [Roseiflexaceae bacterium]|nr:response regulator transcription factor [Roseiflexaceae bacterium]